MKKKIIIIIGIIFVLALFIGYQNNRPLEANLVKVEKKDFNITLKEEGKIVSNTEKTIYAPISGEIEFIVDKSQVVNKGDLILKLNGSDIKSELKTMYSQLKSLKGQRSMSLTKKYEGAVASQEATIEELKIQLEDINKKVEKNNILLNEGAVSREEVENLLNEKKLIETKILKENGNLKKIYEDSSIKEGEYEYYRGQIEALSEKIRHLEVKSKNLEIRASERGYIKNSLYSKGAKIAEGSPVISFQSLEKPTVEVFVLAKDAMSINENDLVKIYFEESGKKESLYSGKVLEKYQYAETRVSSLGLEEQRVGIKIGFESEVEKLGIGYPVDIEFVLKEKKGAIAIPKMSIFDYQNSKAVWKIENEKAKVILIKTGIENTREITVEEGLKVGDYIIEDPEIQGIKEGIKVRTP